MNYIVCLKQVPDTREITYDRETGSLQRDLVGSIANPNDEDALSVAISLREKTGGTIAAITMGPKQARATLRNALSLGVDSAYHMRDNRFSGADVYVTAYSLAQGIREIGLSNIVFCGKQSIDGDTGQVGAELAEQLNYSHIYYVTEIIDINKNHIVVKSKLGNKIQKVKVSLPTVISTEIGVFPIRISSFKDKMLAQKKEINILTLDDLEDKDKENYGYRASPTKVRKMFVPELIRKCSFYDENAHLKQLIEDLKEEIEKEKKQNHFIESGFDNEDKDIIKDKDIIEDKDIIKDIRENQDKTEDKGKLEEDDDNKKSLRLCVVLEENTNVGKEIIKYVTKYRKTNNILIDGVIIQNNRNNIRDSKGDKDCKDSLCKESLDKDLNLLNRLYIYNFPVDHLTTEHYVEGLSQYFQVDNIRPPDILLIGATPIGRSFAPRLAAKYKTGITADCTEIDIDENNLLVQIRPAFQEELLAKIITPEHIPQIATIRPGLLENDELIQGDGATEIFHKELNIDNPRIEILSEKILANDQEGLEDSSLVVIAGDAIKNPDELAKLKDFAKSIGGKVGVTRPLVQGGLAPHEVQVGVSGISLKSNIAILVGVSGSNQTMAGLKKVKKIVAINKDEKARVFSYADVGIVSDWEKLLFKRR